MSFRACAAVLAVVLLAGPAAAQLDPEPKAPYLWRVVLKTQPHPLLSAAFRGQLERDITAALQPALGPLGTVDVIDLADPNHPRDKWDPLWQQFDDKGFAALDASRDLTGAKTHFLKIDYADGQYHLEARQHDGFSGLASPLVRKQSVRAAEMVGRTAGLMLDRDFGLCGTAEAIFGKVDEVKITVRGGQLASVDKFVKVGDVFAVSQVSETKRPAPPPLRTATGKIIAPPPGSVPPRGLNASPRLFTLLKVTEVDAGGTLRAVALTQYKTAMPGGGSIVGYRCMKLGTIEAPLTVRLVSSDGSASRASGVVVKASEDGFKGATAQRDTFDNKDSKDGIYRSARPYSNVACITVSLGTGPGNVFAIPVLSTDTITLPFETDPKVAARVEFERAAVAEFNRVADARLAQSLCFDATAKLIDKQKNSEALARARGGFEAAKAADQSITDTITRLRESGVTSADGAKLLASVEQQLVSIRKHNADLEAHIKTLEAVVRAEDNPAAAAKDVQAKALADHIKLLVKRGDIDQALNAYGQFLTLMPNDADAKAQRDALKAEWTPKNDAHAQAREYLHKTWPALATIPDFRDSMKRLDDAVKVCMDNGDRLGLQKLLTIFSTSLVKLNELNDLLDPNAPGDQKLVQDAKKTGEALAALEERIVQFLSGKK